MCELDLPACQSDLPVHRCFLEREPEEGMLYPSSGPTMSPSSSAVPRMAPKAPSAAFGGGGGTT